MPRSFRLIETLGEGSFGAVHLAEVAGAEGFVQRLAVKWLLPQWSRDGDLVGRLRDEARLLGLLNHDHVVRVHGLTRIDGRLAILMEAVDGVDLSRLDGQCVPPRAALQIVEAVADALDAAWQTVPPGGTEPLRVVHRDIKPSNVMVTTRGGVKVMDFGVARATFDAREARTRSQQFGTARYMAPERWLEGVSDAPSDVFSLGITLIELVGGRPVERPRLAREGFREDLDRALDALAPHPPIAALAREMCAYAPGERPTARDVVERCRALAASVGGSSLRDWAPGFVAARPGRRGPADGSIVHEDVSGETFSSDATEAFTEPALPPTTSMPNPPPPAAPEARPAVRTDTRERPTRERWRQAMGALAIAAATVLAVSAWQVMRPRADDPAIATAPATPPPPPAAASSAPADGDTVAEPLAAPADEPAVIAAAVVPEAPAEPTEPRPKRPDRTAEPAPPPAEPAPDAEPAARDAEPAPDAAPPAPAVEPVIVQFVFDPGLTVMLDPGGPASSRRGVPFLRGQVVRVDVAGAGAPFSCTVTADPSRASWRIDAKERTCR